MSTLKCWGSCAANVPGTGSNWQLCKTCGGKGVIVRDIEPGLYKHYKGDIYRALHVARYSESPAIEAMVYILADPGASKAASIWVRPLKRPLLEGDDCWCDLVEWPDDTTQQRFVRMGD